MYFNPTVGQLLLVDITENEKMKAYKKLGNELTIYTLTKLELKNLKEVQQLEDGVDKDG